MKGVVEIINLVISSLPVIGKFINSIKRKKNGKRTKGGGSEAQQGL